MTTRAPDALRGIYRSIRTSGQYRSMREGGIVGDLSHRRKGGYHISRQDQSDPNNYSVRAPADKRGRSDIARGIDITMNAADMKKMTGRLMNACKKNRADPDSEPRIEVIREFFGTLDGRRVTGWNRYASANRGIGLASSDSSHLWHVHISIFTDYADDPAKMRGLIDILLGKPLKPAPPPPPPPKPDEGDEDVVTNADIDKIADVVVRRVFGDDVIPSWHGGGNWRLRELLPNIRGELETMIDLLEAIKEAHPAPEPPSPDVSAPLHEAEDLDKP